MLDRTQLMGLTAPEMTVLVRWHACYWVPTTVAASMAWFTDREGCTDERFLRQPDRHEQQLETGPARTVMTSLTATPVRRNGQRPRVDLVFGSNSIFARLRRGVRSG